MDIQFASKKVQSLLKKSKSRSKRYAMYTELYNEYRNDFLTVEKFAEYHGIDRETAVMIIDCGKILSELN